MIFCQNLVNANTCSQRPNLCNRPLMAFHWQPSKFTLETEFCLAETRLENEQLRESLKCQHENNDVTKNCIARGDHLTLHQNVIQQLLPDRDALLKTIQALICKHSADIEFLNSKLFLVWHKVIGLIVTGEMQDLKRCNEMNDNVTIDRLTRWHPL